MDRRQIGVNLCLNELLDSGVNVSSFHQRLIMQKTIYLAQAAGVNFGYHFRWYLRGPYSPDVAEDCFSIRADLNGGISNYDEWNLDEKSIKNLNHLKELIPNNPDEKKVSRDLELLASVHFLVTKSSVPKKPVTLVASLKRFNKDYTAEEVETALHGLGEHGLIPQ